MKPISVPRKRKRWRRSSMSATLRWSRSSIITKSFNLTLTRNATSNWLWLGEWSASKAGRIPMPWWTKYQARRSSRRNRNISSATRALRSLTKIYRFKRSSSKRRRLFKRRKRRSSHTSTRPAWSTSEPNKQFPGADTNKSRLRMWPRRPSPVSTARNGPMTWNLASD